MIKWLKTISRYSKLTTQRYKKRDKQIKLYKERYKYSWTVITATLLSCVMAVVIYFLLLNESTGTYLSGWFAFSAIAVLLLVAMSAPNRIVITNKNVILHGYVDLYQIPLSEIKSIEIVHKKCYKHYIPIFVSFGYFGYFGYFLNWKQMEFCMVYATKYTNWVEIKTVEKNTYIINVDNPEFFIENYESIIDSLSDSHKEE